MHWIYPTNKDDDEKDKPQQGPPAASKVLENLFKARTVMIFGEINDKVAASTTAQLLALAQESDDDIKLIINSPGGHVESGDTIHDMIRFIKPAVKVIGTGWVASAGALIFIGAEKENRYCLPNTRFLLHQPSGGAGGRATDLEIEAREIIKMRKRINELFARETGQTLAKIEKDTDWNYWMGVEEAKAYGLVTHIVSSVDQIR